MQRSTVYYGMTLPTLIFGIPRDYLAVAFSVSLLVGGLGSLIITQKGYAAFFGIIPFCLTFWVIGYFMTKRDSEFFGVWLKNCFQIGETVSLKGQRTYEP